MSESPNPGESGGGAAPEEAAPSASSPGEQAPGGGAPGPGPRLHALDPDLAAETARRAAPHVRAPDAVIDTRPYRWIIGVFGLAIVVVISVVSFLHRGVTTTGVPPHQTLRYFAAPLARSDLDGGANAANPTCSLAKHDPRALNICLLVKRGPVVLAFFVAGAAQCKREVDTMQAISRRFPTVQFAAVAVDTSHAEARRIASSHGWTIPVAYDSSGAVGELYDVAVCPLVQLAYRGGMVQARLIGDDWVRPAALALRVRALLASAPR